MTEKTIDQAILTDYTIKVDGDASTQSEINNILQELSIVEFSLSESLLSPTLEASVTVQNARHLGFVKNLDKFAYATMTIDLNRDILKVWNPDIDSTMQASLKIHSINQRVPVSYQYDQFTINACDDTLLINADRLVSKSWHCVPPSQIVSDILSNCIGAPRIEIETATPNRTYFAENIHPFQAISEQSDVALASNNDPSFLHFMTFENGGIHKFQSLQNMVKQPLTFSFYYKEKALNPAIPTYADPTAIMSYEFPCDYDILLDLLNAVDLQGNDQTSLIVINPFNGIQSILGNQRLGCGQGGPQTQATFTNKESANGEDNCETDVEKYKLRRQARLNLLEPDKIPLRITVPFNPLLHVGKMIFVKIPNKQGTEVVPDYGSGNYLISSLTHNVKKGGFGVTILDCVSESVGFGGSTIGK